MTDELIVYIEAAVIALIVFPVLFGLIVAEIRLLFWLFGM